MTFRNLFYFFIVLVIIGWVSLNKIEPLDDFTNMMILCVVGFFILVRVLVERQKRRTARSAYYNDISMKYRKGGL